MIKPEDIIAIDISLTSDEIESCIKIADKTQNTWQNNRDRDEKLYDTIMGKLAEKALKQYLNSLGCFQSCFNNKSICGTELFAFYDDFRTDDFQYHNNIDFIFSKNTGLLFYAIKRVREQSSVENSSNYFRLDDELKTKMNNNDVFICEIKSTRITDRHRDEKGSTSPNLILNDDFLEYPKHCRKSKEITNIMDYIEFVNKNNFNKYKTIEDLLNDEMKSSSDIYFRVYIETFEKIEPYFSKAYIVGLIEKHDFFKKENITLKKMQKKGKSEYPIYFSVNLRSGKPVKQFFRCKILNEELLYSVIS